MNLARKSKNCQKPLDTTKNFSKVAKGLYKCFELSENFLKLSEAS